MRWRMSIGFEPPGVMQRGTEPRGAEPPGATRGRIPRTLLVAAVAVGVATLGTWAVLALGAITGARALSSAAGAATPLIDATHLPPLLTSVDDRLRTLKFDVTCDTAAADPGATCDIQGTVFARAGAVGPFHALPLHLSGSATSGRYVASLPAGIANSTSGFSYYAVIQDRNSDAAVTIPAGGAAAPQRSRRLTSPITVDLGAHRFGSATAPSQRVASAPWGDGPNDVGIEEGPQLTPIGASSFDVDSVGVVTVLDEAHKRLLRFGHTTPSAPAAIPVGVRGTIADLAVRPDGSSYVLESVAESGQTPVMRSFDPSGRLTGSGHAAETTTGTLRLGPDGPLALEYPAGQWMPLATGPASAASTATQLARGQAGRAVAGGREIVSQREGNEARVALVGPGNAVRSWRIRSLTPLAEIQLAEPVGDRVVVVLRSYTDTDSAFLVLVLGDRGLEQHLSIEPSEWAETAPLSRFRLVGSSLFYLGSTPAGMFVDRYDLEVKS